MRSLVRTSKHLQWRRSPGDRARAAGSWLHARKVKRESAPALWDLGRPILAGDRRLCDLGRPRLGPRAIERARARFRLLLGRHSDVCAGPGGLGASVRLAGATLGFAMGRNALGQGAGRNRAAPLLQSMLRAN